MRKTIYVQGYESYITIIGTDPSGITYGCLEEFPNDELDKLVEWRNEKVGE